MCLWRSLFLSSSFSFLVFEQPTGSFLVKPMTQLRANERYHCGGTIVLQYFSPEQYSSSVTSVTVSAGRVFQSTLSGVKSTGSFALGSSVC